MAAKVSKIQLAGERILFYTTPDVLEAERRMQHSVRAAAEALSFTDLVTLLWAGLRHADSRLTADQVMRWIDQEKQGEQSIFGLWTYVLEALINSGVLPKPPLQGQAADGLPVSVGGGSGLSVVPPTTSGGEA